MKTHQQNRADGLLFVDPDNRIEIWAFAWSTILHEARAKLQFINKNLIYSANRETATAYIAKKYAQDIPALPGSMEVNIRDS